MNTRESKILVLRSHLKMPGVQLPLASFLVREGERIALISPLPKLATFRETIEQFGQVTDIVAPNGMHHLGVEAALDLYPEADVWGVPMLRKKRADIVWTHTLGEPPWPFATLLPYPVGGMPMFQEFVFLHTPSATLIVTDLCFNMIHAHGWTAFLLFKLFGNYRRFALSRLLCLFIRDRAAFRSSMRTLLDLNFQSIMMAHGDPVSTDAKVKLRAALAERGLLPE